MFYALLFAFKLQIVTQQKIHFTNPLINEAVAELSIDFKEDGEDIVASDIVVPDEAKENADANTEVSEDIVTDGSESCTEAKESDPANATSSDPSETVSDPVAPSLDWEEEPMDPVAVYPTTTVNIRSLPSTDGEILRQVTISDELTATARIKSYKGQATFFYKVGEGEFISGDYSSFEKTEPLTGNYVPVVKEGIEYYTCGNVVTLPSGDYNINTNYIGLKVIWTNKALLGNTNAKYTQDTVNAVMNLQNSCGLPVTGEVDLETWKAMGYSEDEWSTLGTYITPLKVSAGASHEECVNAMILTAIEYMNAGTDYRIGASGAPGQYADCSGFIFQCLYSIGVNPTINIVDHALAVKEYTSRDLCADDRLGLPVSIADMQPGDLIFYSSNGINVTHVGMYAGNNMMYDSNSGGVKLRSIWNTSTFVKVVRVCP